MALFDENEDLDFPTDEGFEEEMPEEDNNRTFIIIAGILGGIILVSLLCIAGVVAYRNFSGQSTAAEVAETTKIAQNTQVAQMLTETAQAEALAQEPLASPTAVFSPTPSPTPVVAVATETPTATPNVAATGTVAAALTEAADAIQTVIPTSSGLPAELPDGGFADDVGVPGLALMMIVLIGVIFLARRLRSASAN